MIRLSLVGFFHGRFFFVSDQNYRIQKLAYFTLICRFLWRIFYFPVDRYDQDAGQPMELRANILELGSSLGYSHRLQRLDSKSTIVFILQELGSLNKDTETTRANHLKGYFTLEGNLHKYQLNEKDLSFLLITIYMYQNYFISSAICQSIISMFNKLTILTNCRISDLIFFGK